MLVIDHPYGIEKGDTRIIQHQHERKKKGNIEREKTDFCELPLINESLESLNTLLECA